jgi:hypothetical protein
MGRKLEWELSGRSDVPEKMAKAKASMEGLEGAGNALSKKFREAFKDIAVGFLAPMVLIQKIIGFISDKIAQAKADADAAREFAKDPESKKYAPAGGREAILQYMERKTEEDKRNKGLSLASQGYEDFLKNTKEGRAMLDNGPAFLKVFEKFVPDALGKNPNALRENVTAFQMAQSPEVRAAIDAILAKDISKRSAAEAAALAGSNAPTAQKINEISGNVIGVGMSPQLAAMKEQTDLQSDMANSLRALVERDQVAQGFRTKKGEYDLGSPASGGRTVFHR